MSEYKKTALVLGAGGEFFLRLVSNFQLKNWRRA